MSLCSSLSANCKGFVKGVLKSKTNPTLTPPSTRRPRMDCRLELRAAELLANSFCLLLHPPSHLLMYSSTSSASISETLCNSAPATLKLCAITLVAFLFFNLTGHCQGSFYSYAGRSNFQEQTKTADAELYLPLYVSTRHGTSETKLPSASPISLFRGHWLPHNCP